VKKKKQAIGDNLVSWQLWPYDLQRAGEQIILRDNNPHSAPRFVNHFGPFARMQELQK
jgi:hypothetical protein